MYKTPEWYEQDNKSNMLKYYDTDEYHRRNDIILRYMPDDINSIVEIGGCEGDLTLKILQAFPGIKSYYFIDASKTAIEHVRHITSGIDNIWFICEDIEQYKTLLASIHPSLVICTIFEHLNDDLDVIRHIKPNTPIIFSVPNFSCDLHVRTFGDKEEIVMRYGKLIDIIYITDMMNMTLLGKFNTWLLNRWVMKKARWVMKKFGIYTMYRPVRTHFICYGVRNENESHTN